MNKLFLLVTVFGTLALSSCNKSYTCDCGGGDVTEFEDLTKSQRDLAKASCEAAACDWKAGL